MIVCRAIGFAAISMSLMAFGIIKPRAQDYLHTGHPHEKLVYCSAYTAKAASLMKPLNGLHPKMREFRLNIIELLPQFLIQARVEFEGQNRLEIQDWIEEAGISHAQKDFEAIHVGPIGDGQPESKINIFSAHISG